MLKLFLLWIILPNVTMAMMQEPAGTDQNSPIPIKSLLPLVMIRTRNGEFISPTRIHRISLDEGNFVRGTTFRSYIEGKQFFFCGRDESSTEVNNRYCSYELEQESEILTCAHEPVPFVEQVTVYRDGIKFEIPCQSIHHERGKMFAYVYQAKTNDATRSFTFELYRFCYAEETKRVLFTQHIIVAPDLLGCPFFELERKKTYEMSDEGYGFFGNKYQEIKNYYKELEERRELIEETSNTSKFFMSAQKLVPSDDMVFATWRNTTYHFLNVRKMEEKKVQLWDHISQLIREDAIKKSRIFHILTGAFNLTLGDKDENVSIQTPDLWMKIVHYQWGSSEEQNASIGIIMNHNPDNDFVNGTVESYCEKNLCKNAFVEKFPDIGGSVCCTGSVKDIQLFFVTGLKFDKHSILEIDSLVTNDESSDEKYSGVGCFSCS